MITVKRINISNVDDIIYLFDAYRVFYKMNSDFTAAELFLKKRLQQNESIIFGAYENGVAIGFTQLYYTFSSVSLKASLVLNDLYVSQKFRTKGIGKKLLLTAQEYCQKNNFKGLALETAVNNPAQRLYEKLGWTKDSDCFHYFWHAKT